MQKHQPSAIFRWIVLIVISLAMFSNYYLYDSIAPVADLLITDLGFNQVNIGQLYSVYSISAIIILIFGGIFIDKYGTRISIFLFGGICTLAGIITSLSSSLWVMLVGRILLGIGSEPLIVAITVAVAKWFKGKELGFALGVNLFIARAGSFFADRSTSWLDFLYVEWSKPLKFASSIGILCILMGLVYYIMERHASKRYVLGEGGETDKLSFSGLFSFSRSYWFVVLLCFTFYSAVFPFRSFAIKYFHDAHDMTLAMAGSLNSALPMAAMIATPVIGLLIDLIGLRATLMAFGSVLILPVFFMLSFTNVDPYIPVIMLGIGFSLIPAVMWPSVAYIVKEKNLGKAYALMTLIQQAGVAFLNWLIGWVNDVSGASADNPDGYHNMMFLLSILGILGLIFSLSLRKIERGPNGHGLEIPSGKRK